MVIESKKEYLEKIRNRYRRADRKDKKHILDEFCAVCGFHRKHALRLLSPKVVKNRERSGRSARYSKTHDLPKTPWQRRMDSPHINQAQKTHLTEMHCNLNPFKLKKQIDYKQRQILNALR